MTMALEGKKLWNFHFTLEHSRHGGSTKKRLWPTMSCAFRVTLFVLLADYNTFRERPRDMRKNEKGQKYQYKQPRTGCTCRCIYVCVVRTLIRICRRVNCFFFVANDTHTHHLRTHMHIFGWIALWSMCVCVWTVHRLNELATTSDCTWIDFTFLTQLKIIQNAMISYDLLSWVEK